MSTGVAVGTGIDSATTKFWNLILVLLIYLIGQCCCLTCLRVVQGGSAADYSPLEESSHENPPGTGSIVSAQKSGAQTPHSDMESTRTGLDSPASLRAKAKGRALLGQLKPNAQTPVSRLNLVNDISPEEALPLSLSSQVLDAENVPNGAGEPSDKKPPRPKSRGESSPGSDIDRIPNGDEGSDRDVSPRSDTQIGSVPHEMTAASVPSYQSRFAGSTNTRGDRRLAQPTYVTPRTAANAKALLASSGRRQYRSPSPANSPQFQLVSSCGSQDEAVPMRKRHSPAMSQARTANFLDRTSQEAFVVVKFDWTSLVPSDEPVVHRMRILIRGDNTSQPPFDQVVAEQIKPHGLSPDDIHLSYVDDELDECRITTAAEWAVALEFALNDSDRHTLHVRAHRRSTFSVGVQVEEVSRHDAVWGGAVKSCLLAAIFFLMLRAVSLCFFQSELLENG